MRLALFLLISLCCQIAYSQNYFWYSLEGELAGNSFLEVGEDKVAGLDFNTRSSLAEDKTGFTDDSPIYSLDVSSHYNQFITDHWLISPKVTYSRIITFNYISAELSATHFGNIGDRFFINKRLGYKWMNNFEVQNRNTNFYNFGLTYGYKLTDIGAVGFSAFQSIDAYKVRERNSIIEHYRFFDRMSFKQGFNFVVNDRVSANLYYQTDVQYWFTAGNQGCADVNKPECKLNVTRPHFGLEVNIFLLKSTKNATLRRLYTFIE